MVKSNYEKLLKRIEKNLVKDSKVADTRFELPPVDVYVGGREVVSEGSHVEEDRIEEAFLQTMKRILC